MAADRLDRIRALPVNDYSREIAGPADYTGASPTMWKAVRPAELPPQPGAARHAAVPPRVARRRDRRARLHVRRRVRARVRPGAWRSDLEGGRGAGRRHPEDRGLARRLRDEARSDRHAPRPLDEGPG